MWSRASILSAFAWVFGIYPNSRTVTAGTSGVLIQQHAQGQQVRVNTEFRFYPRWGGLPSLTPESRSRIPAAMVPTSTFLDLPALAGHHEAVMRRVAIRICCCTGVPPVPLRCAWPCRSSQFSASSQRCTNGPGGVNLRGPFSFAVPRSYCREQHFHHRVRRRAACPVGRG